MMTLDNGATDGESNSHSVILRCVKGFEESVSKLRVETNPHIFYAEAHLIASFSFGPDQQLPPAVLDVAHRVRGIPQQVQNDLLKLNTIACDGREIVGKFRPQNHPVCLQFAQQ